MFIEGERLKRTPQVDLLKTSEAGDSVITPQSAVSNFLRLHPSTAPLLREYDSLGLLDHGAKTLAAYRMLTVALSDLREIEPETAHSVLQFDGGALFHDSGKPVISPGDIPQSLRIFEYERYPTNPPPVQTRSGGNQIDIRPASVRAQMEAHVPLGWEMMVHMHNIGLITKDEAVNWRSLIMRHHEIRFDEKTESPGETSYPRRICRKTEDHIEALAGLILGAADKATAMLEHRQGRPPLEIAVVKKKLETVITPTAIAETFVSRNGHAPRADSDQVAHRHRQFINLAAGVAEKLQPRLMMSYKYFDVPLLDGPEMSIAETNKLLPILTYLGRVSWKEGGIRVEDVRRKGYVEPFFHNQRNGKTEGEV